MRDDANERIDRLIAWIKSNRTDLCKDGEPDAAQLAAATGKKPTYWYDLLRKQPGRSFGAKAARDIEDKLSIPLLLLEGAGWPFEEVDQFRYDRLNDIQKGRVQQALNEFLDKLEAEKSSKAAGLGKATVGIGNGISQVRNTQDSMRTAKVYELKRMDGIGHNDARSRCATGQADKSRSAEIVRIF